MFNKSRLQKALDLILEEQENILRGGDISENIGKEILLVKKKLKVLRNDSIRADVRCGLKQNSVADKYGLTPSMVSQILRKSHSP